MGWAGGGRSGAAAVLCNEERRARATSPTNGACVRAPGAETAAEEDRDQFCPSETEEEASGCPFKIRARLCADDGGGLERTHVTAVWRGGLHVIIMFF